MTAAAARVAAARAAARRPDRPTLLLAAIAVLGAGLVLAREATYGVGLHFDSAWYLTTARNLLEGDGFVQAGGVRYENWPPLYPLLLAAATLGAFDPYEAAGPLNAAAFGLTILVAGRWMRQRLASRFLAAWCCLAIAFSAPVAGAATLAWSEPLFILFVTLSLSETDAYLETGRRRSLLTAAGAAALACLTRYTGVVLLAAMLPLLALRPGAAPRERARDLAAWTLIAALPLAAWLLRNLLLTGAPIADRGPAAVPLEGHLRLALEVFAGWLRPPPGVSAVAPASALLVALDAAALAGFLRWAQRGRGAATAPVAGAFAFAYLAAMILAVATTDLTPLNDRYLSPAYVPLLVLFAFAADRLLTRAAAAPLPPFAGPRARAVRRWAAFALLAVPLALWAARAGAAETRAAWEAVTGPAPEWTVRHWERDSPAVRWLRAHPAEGRVYSNARPLVHLFVLDDPSRNLDPPPDRRALFERLAEGDLVVLFHDVQFGPPPSYGAHDLDLPGLRTAARLDDAVIFAYGEE